MMAQEPVPGRFANEPVLAFGVQHAPRPVPAFVDHERDPRLRKAIPGGQASNASANDRYSLRVAHGPEDTGSNSERWFVNSR